MVAVLVVGAGAALTGRLLLSPSSPNQSVTNLANPDHPATTEPGTGFDGANVGVSGDVTGEFHVEGGEPSMDGKHETFADDTSLLSFARDEQGAYVDHLIYDDLDFYLGRDDCETEVGQPDTDTGFATATFSCTDIEDVHGRATVSVDGSASLFARVARVGFPDLGGTITVSDGGSLNWTFTPEDTNWTLLPEDDRPLGWHEVWIFDQHSESIAFDSHNGALSLSLIQRGSRDYEISPGVCQATVTKVTELSAIDIIVRVDLDCPTVEVQDLGALSVTGSLLLEQVDHRSDDS